MDQLNMLSLAFEIRTDVASKWSVNALFSWLCVVKKIASMDGVFTPCL